MPLGDIAGEILGGIVRILVQVILDIVLEILIKGPGYLICRPFRKDINPDGATVIVVGLLFWAIVLGASYAAYTHFTSAGA